MSLNEALIGGLEMRQPCIRTVLKEGTGEYIEKRSRFLSRVYPVETEREALVILEHVKKEFWDARHHCYAYVIDTETTIQRFSDDGEPSGTAGIPILETLRRKELTNTFIVVTRYFGGVLLGAAGLVRAYGKAASSGLSDAQIITRKLCYKAILCMEYHFYGKLCHYMAEQHFIEGTPRFSEHVETEIFVEPERKESFEIAVAELTGGMAEITYQGRMYLNFDENGVFIPSA